MCYCEFRFHVRCIFADLKYFKTRSADWQMFQLRCFFYAKLEANNNSTNQILQMFEFVSCAIMNKCQLVSCKERLCKSWTLHTSTLQMWTCFKNYYAETKRIMQIFTQWDSDKFGQFVNMLHNGTKFDLLHKMQQNLHLNLSKCPSSPFGKDEFCSANDFSPIAGVSVGDKKLDLESMLSASRRGFCQNIQN